MKIGYVNRKTEEICTRKKEATKHLSGIKPELLFQRIGELAAFDDLGQIPFQVPPLHFHPLRENHAGQYGVTLHSLTRIVFEPAGDFERLDDGTPDKSTVTAITILSIGDYH